MNGCFTKKDLPIAMIILITHQLRENIPSSQGLDLGVLSGVDEEMMKAGGTNDDVLLSTCFCLFGIWLGFVK